MSIKIIKSNCWINCEARITFDTPIDYNYYLEIKRKSFAKFEVHECTPIHTSQMRRVRRLTLVLTVKALTTDEVHSMIEQVIREAHKSILSKINNGG